MKRIAPNIAAFAVGIPVALGVVGSVILTRPDGEDHGPAGTVAVATAPATATPTRTPTPSPTATARPPAPTAAPVTATPTATSQVLRHLTGIRFGTIDVVSNPSGEELPFPADFALSGHFVMDAAGSRIQYGLDSLPFMPLLTGTSTLGPQFNDDGGHGEATGSGKFMGITTDWTMDFTVSAANLSALITIGKSGNLPGGQPVELAVSVAEAWQVSP